MNVHDIHLAINNALLTYCRGIDRLDGALVAAAFHPGATLIDYGAQPMTIEQFAEYAPGSLAKKFVATQHRISNTQVEIDASGASAKVETYVLAYHVQLAEDGSKVLQTFNGRYIDRFEERNGTWKIAQRTLRNDWSKVEPIEATMSSSYIPSGRGGTPDPLDD